MNKDKIKNDLLAALPLTITTVILFVASVLLVCAGGKLNDQQKQSVVKEIVKGR